LQDFTKHQPGRPGWLVAAGSVAKETELKIAFAAIRYFWRPSQSQLGQIDSI
jgi:hypothetical protein